MKMRTVLRSGVALAPLAALLVAGTAHAEADSPASGAAAAQVEEVVVTGSRIARTGFTTPTPTTMIGADDIAKKAPVNIADVVNQLPQLAASSNPRVNNGNTSTGLNGINSLNLRGLGVNRTLVLLDGQRVVAATPNGNVDINNLPTALVERIDVVTGGASAAYGSDAVAGVVNFVLNKKFEGLKGTLAAGMTSRQDDQTYNVDLAYGHSFAGGRGHVLLSAEYADVQGIDFLDPNERKWFKSCDMLSFAASARPQRIVACGVNARTVAQGGVITSTALANTQFLAGGAPAPFVLGSPVDTNFMVGGNVWYEGNTIALDSAVRRETAWGRVSYDLTDNITGSLEASYGKSRTANTAAYQRFPGSGSTALTMRADNPFLNPAVAAQARALGISTFLYGYSSYDLGRPKNVADRETYRVVASLNGKFGDGWKWDAYYQYGETDIAVELRNTTNSARFKQAIDATRDATGKIVCRSTLTNPADGCVPLNIFGIGVASPEAIAYVKGVATQNLTLKQNVAAATLSGEPFSLWAGPVSIATGAEYRKEQITGDADALSLVNGWFTGNYKPTFGEFNVKEVFGEVAVPLAKDLPFARSIEFNGAVRYTDYSISGTVTTWKAGLTWTPVEDVRFRAVRSRDIRAPNMTELFAGGQTIATDVIDTSQPSRPSIRTVRVQQGNLNLVPERADTTSLGVVYRPSWAPGFNASIDYYSIDINDAIATPAPQEAVDRCARGETALCALVPRNAAGQITQILQIPVNVAEQKATGVDVEASYRRPIGDLGALTARVLATRTLDFYTLNGGVKTDALGQNTGSIPKWRWNASLSFDAEKYSLTATARGFSSGVYDNTWTSGVEIDDNHIPGATYVDLSGQYRIRDDAHGKIVAFFTIENLFDKDPALVAGGSLSSLQTNPILYDVIGRNYRAGVRFQF
ncbi:MAG: TonB-dependent receptor [Caulobacterales bacterium]|nr:TonB-dependent receptor [Caulobacterales bacterium]